MGTAALTWSSPRSALRRRYGSTTVPAISTGWNSSCKAPGATATASEQESRSSPSRGRSITTCRPAQAMPRQARAPFILGWAPTLPRISSKSDGPPESCSRCGMSRATRSWSRKSLPSKKTLGKRNRRAPKDAKYHERLYFTAFPSCNFVSSVVSTVKIEP
jgi:hypothetical protein